MMNKQTKTPRSRRKKQAAESPDTTPAMPVQVADFLADLARQERSPHTRAAYGQDLVDFARWFVVSNGEEFSAAAVTPTDVRGYKSHLQAVRGRKPTTINRRLAALRTFFRWAVGSGLVAGDPTATVETVRTTTTAPRSLPRSDLNRLTREAQKDAQAQTHVQVAAHAHDNVNEPNVAATRREGQRHMQSLPDQRSEKFHLDSIKFAELLGT